MILDRRPLINYHRRSLYRIFSEYYNNNYGNIYNFLLWFDVDRYDIDLIIDDFYEQQNRDNKGV